MAKIPERLGTVKLIRQIGVGRHCQVWQGRDEKAGRDVAVKVIVPEKASDADQRRLLEHEFKVASSLDHPTIIRVDRLALDGELPHLAMEWYPHPNLKQRIAAGIDALAPRVQRIATEVALGLDHVHGKGWVHRDVKPDNVLVADDGQVKLIDLAIAARSAGLIGKLLGTKPPPQGSPSYMSPEQIRGQALDARSDIYSFGCMLFELLAGRPPYAATDRNDLLNKHVSAPIPAVEKYNANASTAISRCIRQMLAKKPAERPASIKEVLQQLRTTRLFERPVG